MQGNLNYTIKDLGEDEIGKLGQSFNNMTKKLSEARMQLFQSDKMASLGRLAAGVAHEINNPLTGVLTYSSFLLKRTKDNPEFQEDLKVIVRETLRSREIVKSLLDFARQSVPKKSSADINEIINKSISVY
ncbi:MAG: HAMP domain-containing protein [Ignavibacteriales bacterium]|nr:HAMP domain-containing protein [Ignavibacteriales bacterium]